MPLSNIMPDRELYKTFIRRVVNKDNFVAFLVFVLAFLIVPFNHLGGFDLMPGDLGDARLNNYFLENVFKFLKGESESLWHFSFFYPFPYTLGFSENLFGSAPIYVLTRLFFEETDTAFQIWFYFGYFVNFYSAYYALRRFNGSALAATVGALIFAFALPTMAHMGHAQLHYRFGLPLAIVFLADFYRMRTWHYLLIAIAWLVWQFYAGIYIGFFTLLLMATMSVVYACLAWNVRKASDNEMKLMLSSWRAQSKRQKAVFLGGMFLLLSLLILLFYPYLQVSRLYGATRGWNEIASMLPRPQSYLLADRSFLWRHLDAKIFSEIPLRYEHQMFIGFIPMMLALAGFIVGNRKKNGMAFHLMTGMFGLAIVLTLYVGGFSFWYLLHKLPLVSAIRAMVRLDQAFLFPVAYLAVIAIDALKRYAEHVGKIFIVLVFMFIFESNMVQEYATTKDSWRQRISTLDASIPPLSQSSKDFFLFFAQRDTHLLYDEIDSMWVSLNRGFKTMNGYSGFFPPGYDYFYGDDCSQLSKRIVYYLNFIGKSEDSEIYHKLIYRAIPLGFRNCGGDVFVNMPRRSASDFIYTEDDFRHITYGPSELVMENDKQMVYLSLDNSANHAFASISSVGKPILLSWRFIGFDGQPLSGWDNRKELPYDIPANGKLEFSIILNPEEMVGAKEVQISLVQELVFWAHDIGIQPLVIPLN